MDLNNNCPACGGKGTIGYHINSYGQVVKQCNNCNYVITDDVVTTDKTTVTDYNQSTTRTNTPLSNGLKPDVDHMYSIAPPPPLTLEIKCDSITLKQNDISICFCEKDIKQFDSIIINGIKFKKVEEDNDC